MYKCSTDLVKRNAAIFVGNVQAGVVFEEVNETYTTQTAERNTTAT